MEMVLELQLSFHVLLTVGSYGENTNNAMSVVVPEPYHKKQYHLL
jgi:hypothetical protein